MSSVPKTNFFQTCTNAAYTVYGHPVTQGTLGVIGVASVLLPRLNNTLAQAHKESLRKFTFISTGILGATTLARTVFEVRRNGEAVKQHDKILDSLTTCIAEMQAKDKTREFFEQASSCNHVLTQIKKTFSPEKSQNETEYFAHWKKFNQEFTLIKDLYRSKEIADLTAQISTLVAELSTANQNLQTANDRIDELERQFEESTGENQALKGENQALKAKLDAAEAKLADKTDLSNRFETKLNEQQKEIDALRAQLKQVLEQNKVLRDKDERNSEKHTKLEADVKRLSNENIDLNAKNEANLCELKAQLKAMREEYDTKIALKDQEVVERVLKIVRLKQETEAADPVMPKVVHDDYKGVEVQNQALKEENKKLENDKNALAAKLTDEDKKEVLKIEKHVDEFESIDQKI